jgi:hypothetical protein
MALPFLTLLAPSKRFYADKARAPKTLLDWARQAASAGFEVLPANGGHINTSASIGSAFGA